MESPDTDLDRSQWTTSSTSPVAPIGGASPSGPGVLREGTSGRAAGGAAVLIGEASPSSAESDEGSKDGRTMRRRRNRDAVIVALLDLIREGELEPSVASIADRAEVSHRSVFRYFTDLNDLVRTAIEHEVKNAIPLSKIEDLGEGTFDRRVDSYVDSRLRVHAYAHQVGRVARLKSAAIPAVDEGLAHVSELERAQLRQQFATEIAKIDETEAEFVLDAAVVLTSFESYDLHRRRFKHGNERVRAVWNDALHALFDR